LRSRSGAALLLMAFCFLLVGLIALRWELVSLVIPMAMIMYLAFLLHRPPLMDVRLTRTLDSDRVQEGDVVEVTLTLENRGEGLDYIEVFDSLPPGAAVMEGRERFPLSLEKGHSATLRYKLRFDRRGSFSFGELTVRWSDPTQMVVREQRIYAEGRIVVLPRIQDLRRCDLEPATLKNQSGSISSSSIGPGSEFYCLREYVLGDELRKVNWKATGKRDRMIVNDYESERSGDVVILVDARTSISDQGVRQRMVDLEVDAAASLASYFLKHRDRVGVLVLGDTMEVVPLGYGKRHFYRAMDRLLVTQPGSVRQANFLASVMERYFPTSSLIVAITPMEDRRLVSSLVGMGGKGHDVFVLSLDTFPLEQAQTRDATAKEVAELMHRLRRKDLLAELGRYCRAVDWDPRVPLFKYLMEGRASGVRRR
jgi:uncharacterized protein (DUF58 family)